MSRRVPASAALALACAMAVTVARAVRFPNSFARAHWLLDYRFGFMKRALPGASLVALSRAGLLHLRRQTVETVAILMFSLLCAALFAIALRVLSRDRWSVPAFAALAAFFTSAYVVTAGHLMGYLDHVVALLALAAVWCALRRRYWTVGILAMAAVLVHETVILTGVPVMLIAIALVPAAPRGRALLRALVPMCLPFAAGAAIILTEQSEVRRMALRANLVRRLSAFPWITGDMNIFVPEWLTTRVVDHLREEAHAFPSRIASPGFVLDIVPVMVVLWLLACVLWRWRPPLVAASAAAIAAPLLLHFVAFDTAREWSYPLFVAFSCVWLASETGGGAGAWSPRTAPLVAALASAIVALDMFMRYPLLDYEVDRFTNAQRAALYLPFLIAAAVFAVWRRRTAAPQG